MPTQKTPRPLLVAFVVTFALLIAIAPVFSANPPKVLHRFSGGDGGAFPDYGNLIFDTAGNLYGTTYEGGAAATGCYDGCGTVFELTPAANGKWTEIVLHRFQNNGRDGYFPMAGLVIDTAGNLYGTTSQGGSATRGTVFRLGRDANGQWNETVLYDFCSVSACADGADPYSGLIIDASGNLYGTTWSGGSGNSGTVFELSPRSNGRWSETVLYSFEESTRIPASLIFDATGNLYGTTGGANTLFCESGGDVFELSPSGNGSWTFTELYAFQYGGKDGGCPAANLIFDAAGNLYGTTFLGGANGSGTVFELTLVAGGGWAEEILHSFNINEGAQPAGDLIFDSAGNLYGTLTSGGRFGLGAVFKLSPSGAGWTEQAVHHFDGRNGTYPFSGLISDGAGTLYGTTYYGGDLINCSYTGCGVVYAVTP